MTNALNLTHANYEITDPEVISVPYLHATLPVLDGDQTITVDGLSFYKTGSVSSPDGIHVRTSCRIAAVERARKLGHELHYIYSLGSRLTAHKETAKPATLVQIGQEYVFEGRLFTIERANNNNLRFVQTAIIDLELFATRGKANLDDLELFATRGEANLEAQPSGQVLG